jgi:hypothetical protein
MLVFALQYWEALNVVTGDCDMKLWQYEMDAEAQSKVQFLGEIVSNCHTSSD